MEKNIYKVEKIQRIYIYIVEKILGKKRYFKKQTAEKKIDIVKKNSGKNRNSGKENRNSKKYIQCKNNYNEKNRDSEKNRDILKKKKAQWKPNIVKKNNEKKIQRQWKAIDIEKKKICIMKNIYKQ